MLTTLAGVVGVLLFIIYVVLPLIFRYSAAFQRQLVFFPYNFLVDALDGRLRWSTAINYSQPEFLGLKGARNFDVTTDHNVRVGVWHLLPKCLIRQSFQDVDESLASGHPIVYYLHGNSGCRATRHRMKLYKVLQSLDYHVISIDYRGFGDSSNVVMSENGAVTDATKVLEYIQKFSKQSTLIVWGHSLGTGVATKMMAQLYAKNKSTPDGLILESAFNNLRDVFRNHVLTQIYRPLSVVDRFFTERLVTNNVAFDTEIYIVNVECPILMLHAQDDPIVPISLPKKLYQVGQKWRPVNWPPLELIEFPKELNCSHNYICRAKELPSIIRKFVDSTSPSKEK